MKPLFTKALGRVLLLARLLTILEKRHHLSRKTHIIRLKLHFFASLPYRYRELFPVHFYLRRYCPQAASGGNAAQSTERSINASYAGPADEAKLFELLTIARRACSTASKVMRSRFSRLPPYASVRLLVMGE